MFLVMKIFKIYYLSSNDFFNAQIVSNLASGNSFKGLWHFFTIWQYMMLHALSCNYPGYNLGYTFPYTPTHPVNCQQILEVIGLYDQNREGRVVTLGIETWCTWRDYFMYTEAHVAFWSEMTFCSGEKRKI